MRIAILTGGGDVPGLNNCIKAAVRRASDASCEVLGLRRGWSALVDINPSDPLSAGAHTVLLNRVNTRTIDRSGGTFLHTSRTNPARVRRASLPPWIQAPPDESPTIDCTRHALGVLDHLGIDALIAIGGDDTLSYAVRLHREGIPVVCVPKTMDNDVHGTDYCIGFSTAVTRSVDFIHALRTAAGSHERIAVVELFGRYSGETSLVSAYLAGVDRAIIPEVDFDPRRVLELLLDDRAGNPSRYAVCTISEGAKPIGGQMALSGDPDPYGHKKLGGIGQWLAREIERGSTVGTVFQPLGYLMRSGAPDALDRMVATSYGQLAVDVLIDGHKGRMVALRNGIYTTIPVDEITAGQKRVDVDELYDPQSYRPRVARLLGKPMFLY